MLEEWMVASLLWSSYRSLSTSIVSDWHYWVFKLSIDSISENLTWKDPYTSDLLSVTWVSWVRFLNADTSSSSDSTFLFSVSSLSFRYFSSTSTSVLVLFNSLILFYNSCLLFNAYEYWSLASVSSSLWLSIDLFRKAMSASLVLIVASKMVIYLSRDE